jgi:anti-sigma factor RsiW
VEAVTHLSIELIERYALRELSDVELLQVEKHVASCPECLDRLQGKLIWRR